MPRLKPTTPLLGSGQAARYLGLHRSTLTLWRRQGHLIPTAIEEGPRGRRFLFSIEDLDAFREKIDYAC
ncbi:helix-turn-helix domain-containing protein [Tautonia sp. JC769]|uniref:helix-turn-helix domain-containing protein n=1 Tax=Tautonia sp. JC769 TaxID=3232135 RepID=UPI00345A9896